jgi:hypothetical protein
MERAIQAKSNSGKEQSRERAMEREAESPLWGGWKLVRRVVLGVA